MKKIFFTTIALFSISSAMADSVEDMCTDSDKICACAAKQLKSEVGADDYGLYETIGAAYIANKAKGMALGDAWDAAVKAEAGKRGDGFTKTLTKTNSIGSTHRKAIKACKD
jgi:hypothetical protein